MFFSSANAAPEFEGRGGEDLATEISTELARAYASFPTEKLCILPGLQSWKLYADILVLECGGNLFDAVSLAVKVLYICCIAGPWERANSTCITEIRIISNDIYKECVILSVSASGSITSYKNNVQNSYKFRQFKNVYLHRVCSTTNYILCVLVLKLVQNIATSRVRRGAFSALKWCLPCCSKQLRREERCFLKYLLPVLQNTMDHHWINIMR